MLKNTALRSFVVLLLCVYLINAQRTYLDFKVSRFLDRSEQPVGYKFCLTRTHYRESF